MQKQQVRVKFTAQLTAMTLCAISGVAKKDHSQDFENKLRHFQFNSISFQAEESREIKFLQAKQHEVISLEQQIKAKAETQKKAGIELEATCQVCLKTKFADGIGHLCNYCNVRCCARCGGKVTLRSNKSIWVCILCRKKQELLIKSGKWMSGGGVPTNNDPILRKIELDMAPTPGWSQASVIWLEST